MENNQYNEFRVRILEEISEIFDTVANNNIISEDTRPQDIVRALNKVTRRHLEKAKSEQRNIEEQDGTAKPDRPRIVV